MCGSVDLKLTNGELARSRDIYATRFPPCVEPLWTTNQRADQLTPNQIWDSWTNHQIVFWPVNQTQQSKDTARKFENNLVLVQRRIDHYYGSY